MNCLDARFSHPFTSIVAGPTRSGKSTFVRNLMDNQSQLIDTPFDYIFIFLGTDANANPILSDLKSSPSVCVFEVRKLFPTEKQFEHKFPEFFQQLISSRKGQNGCVIFDDLMKELSQCNMLVNLFTKYSSHNKVSVIHITQNIFFKGSGKHSSDNVTLYRNTHVLVHFRSPMDQSVFRTIASRMGENSSADLLKMLNHIVNKYRYVVIRGDLETKPSLRYTSDLFATKPTRHIKAFSLNAS